jgi:hypothetical protein
MIWKNILVTRVLWTFHQILIFSDWRQFKINQSLYNLNNVKEGKIYIKDLNIKKLTVFLKISYFNRFNVSKPKGGFEFKTDKDSKET